MKKVFFRGRQDKLELMARVFQSYLLGDVLDVGCDQKIIKPFVRGRYVGIDIGGAPDVYANVEYGLPFRDKNFDTVIAFDSLEHLDHIHFAFDELCRVASRYVIIGLPNMYEWRFRLRFLIGKPISGKYGLPADAPLDRHRWLLSLRDAIEFVHQRGRQNGFLVVDEAFGYYEYRKLIARLINTLGCLLGSRGISLFVYHYWAVLEKRL